MVTTYGAATLERMNVWADEIVEDAGGRAARCRVTVTLGELIATLGSIDDDEIDWQNVRHTTVLIHQTFRYDYPAPITALRQRLMVVPPDYHGDQRLVTHKLRVSGCNLDSERSYDSFGNVVLDLTRRGGRAGTSSSRPGSVVEREAAVDGLDEPDDARPRPALRASPRG